MVTCHCAEVPFIFPVTITETEAAALLLILETASVTARRRCGELGHSTQWGHAYDVAGDTEAVLRDAEWDAMGRGLRQPCEPADVFARRVGVDPGDVTAALSRP